MIEDKALGLKIAENSDEAFWTTTKETCEKAIKDHLRNIEISQKILDLATQKLLSVA